MIGFLAALSLPLALLVIGLIRTIRVGINLDDEGYLIYGTQAVLRGEIPIRDFRAYDPGRYYWCALWFRLIAPGFITARIAMAVLSVGSVTLIVALLFHATGSALVACATACLALLWMSPIYRQVEVFFSVVCCVALYALVSGIGNPMAIGAIGAIAAFFGLNILVYFVGAALLVFIVGSISGLIGFTVVVLPFFAGLLISCAILCALIALIPGALTAYFARKVSPLWRRGTTNLPMPRPWIWAVTPPEFKRYVRWRRMAFQLLFTAPPLVCIMTIGWIAIVPLASGDRLIALALAAACTGLAYFHHVHSRADVRHIYGVLQPIFILGGMLACLMFGSAGAAIVLGMTAIGSILLLKEEPDFIFGSHISTGNMVPFEIGNDRFLLPAKVKEHLLRIQNAVSKNGTFGDLMFAAPASPGLLALFNRKTAVYDTFPVYMATQAARETMLAEISKTRPSVAAITNVKIDGREDLLFVNNYPEVADYIFRHYDVARSDAVETIYVRRSGAK